MLAVFDGPLNAAQPVQPAAAPPAVVYPADQPYPAPAPVGTAPLPWPCARPVRAAFNLFPVDLNMLVQIASRRRVSVGEALRTAIATEHFLSEATGRGDTIYLEGRDGRLQPLRYAC